jgi:hypothetical protein
MLISSTYLTIPKIKIPPLWNSENGSAWPVEKKKAISSKLVAALENTTNPQYQKMLCICF